MAKRKRRRSRSRARPFSPFVVLVLWLGVLAVGVVSLEEAPQQLAQQEEFAPLTAETPATDNGPESSNSTSDPWRARPAEHLNPVPDRAAGEASTESRPSDVRSQSPESAAAESPSEARTPTEIEAPDTDHSNADNPIADNDVSEEQDGADIATLETPEDVTEITDSPHVARARFTTGIEAREPIDQVVDVFHSQNRPVRTLYYFTEIMDMAGETVTHQWEYEGEVIASVPFEIGSASWRTWSSKDLRADMPGRWRVIVTDDQGRVLVTDSFIYR